MIIRSICPATRSCMAGPPPRYGTKAKRVPVSFWNRRPATCDPAVGIACDALSGLAFNHATRPFRSSADTAFFAKIRNGLLESRAMRIRQTSDEEYGQIYVPFINWTMMVCTVALTVGFATSDRLAGAYGTAVSTTMLLTTALLYHVMRERWGWSVPAALTVSTIFIVIDFALFAANLVKIAQGGWVPLGFGLLVFSVMTIWHYGTEAVRARHATAAMPPKQFFQHMREMNIPRSS